MTAPGAELAAMRAGLVSAREADVNVKVSDSNASACYVLLGKADDEIARLTRMNALLEGSLRVVAVQRGWQEKDWLEFATLITSEPTGLDPQSELGQTDDPFHYPLPVKEQPSE